METRPGDIRGRQARFSASGLEYGPIATPAPHHADDAHGLPAMNLPNQLTLARVIMVPIFVAFLSFDYWWCYWLGYVVFTLATITDYYDGKIARERNLITNFGKLLDPVADKVLVSAAFIMMMTLPSAQDPSVKSLIIPGWTVIAILSREFLITGLRLLAVGDGVVIAASNYGKAKTVLQLVYIFVFLFLAGAEHFVVVGVPDIAPFYRKALEMSSLWAMVAIALYTLYSGYEFLRANWQNLHLGIRS